MAGPYVDVVRTFLVAQTAVVAGPVVLRDVQKLKFRPCMEDFKKVAQDAEASEQYRPWYAGSEDISYIIESEQHTDPHPELK